MDTPQDRKLQREIAARKQAEHLLEAKSRELFSTNQQLQFALKELEKASEHNILKLEFQQQIDAVLIHFGRTFLDKNLDDVILTDFIQSLSENAIIQSCLLQFNDQCSLQFAQHRFGDIELTNACRAQLTWYKSTLHLPLKVAGIGIGYLSVKISQYDDFQSVVERSISLVGELLSSAISRQTIIDRNIRSRRRAEASERSTRDFLAMINHELRTPLNGLLGSSELLKDTQMTTLQKELIDNVEQSGEFLRVIINDLLDFSKLNAGMFELFAKDFSWAMLEKTLLSIFTGKAKEKSIQFAINSHQDLPRYFHGDLERITQILVNIIGNAIKFTDKGHVTLDAVWHHDTLQLTVTDSGIGISSKAQKQLFKPFSQADRSSKRQFEGTGLGLAICDQLIKLMNGTIEVNSEIDKGSRFIIRLPLSTHTQSELSNSNASTTAKPPTLSHVKILVVEDIRMNQIVIEKMLEKLSITPDIANNGFEALSATENNRYDLIFMDCRMPKMDGFEATQALRNKGYKQPIIALTASTTSDERERCITSGMDDLLPKPYRGAQLQQVIEKWVES